MQDRLIAKLRRILAPVKRRIVAPVKDRIGTVDTRYQAARALAHRRLRLQAPRDPLLVFTMGKVASTAIYNALKARLTDRSVFQLHWLTAGRLAADDAQYLAAARAHRNTPLERRFRPRYVWEGQYLSGRLNEATERGVRHDVVTLVRDPVARNVSAFFQNLLLFFNFDHERELQTRPVAEVAADMRRLYLDHYVQGQPRILHDGDPLTWLDDELKAVFGIDVYSVPFPKSEGFRLYESAEARVLLLRVEDLKRSAAPAFKAFLDLDDFTLPRSNAAQDKDYAALYAAFLEGISFPADYLERMYGSKMARHFYTADELARFRAQWRTS